jgi:nucleotide-binding universal stress UspA family protein
MTVLVGTDLSESSGFAVRAAAAVASLTGDSLEILYALESADSDAFWRRFVSTPWEEPKALKKAAKKRLDERLDAEFADDFEGLTVRTEVVLDRADDALTHRAESDDIELLVVGKTGRAALTQALLGSTAENVVRSAEVPVWVIPPEVDASDIRRILAPVDLSQASRSNLKESAEWARVFDAELTVLHSLSPPASSLNPGEIEATSGDLDHYRFEGRQRLEEFVASTLGAQHSAQLKLTLEAPFSAILETADDIDADLLVMSTHGRSGLSRLLMGSTTAKVLRRTERPLLTVRPKEDGPLEGADTSAREETTQ